MVKFLDHLTNHFIFYQIKILMNNNLAYFKYLEIIRKTYPEEMILDIDPVSRLILDEIAFHENRHHPLTITVMMSYLHIASQATIHRKLTYLVEEGLVHSKCVGTNRRTKHLTVSKLAHRYYKTISQAMIKACAST